MRTLKDQISLLEQILDLVKGKGPASRKDIDALLMPILPDALTEQQKVTKIGHLLTALKKAGAIYLGDKKAWVYTGNE
jgi:ATP-dependent DNA helicase RecG